MDLNWTSLVQNLGLEEKVALDNRSSELIESIRGKPKEESEERQSLT